MYEERKRKITQGQLLELKVFSTDIMFPFIKLEHDVKNQKIEKCESFKKAKTAFQKTKKTPLNNSLRAKAYKAFELCYADLELYEKATQMKLKYDQLCEKHNLKLDL